MNCLLCKGPGEVQIDTNDAVFYSCLDPDCNKTLPLYLKEHHWMIETSKDITFTYEEKKVTYHLDGRTIPSLGKKLMDLIKKCKSSSQQ